MGNSGGFPYFFWLQIVMTRLKASASFWFFLGLALAGIVLAQLSLPCVFPFHIDIDSFLSVVSPLSAVLRMTPSLLSGSLLPFKSWGLATTLGSISLRLKTMSKL